MGLQKRKKNLDSETPRDERSSWIDALLNRATARRRPGLCRFRAQLLRHIAMEEKILLPGAPASTKYTLSNKR